MTADREIEAGKSAIQKRRRLMYDIVKNCTGNPPSSDSNLLDRNMRDDIARDFSKAALQAAEQARWLPISEAEEVKKDGRFALVYGAPVFSGSCVAQWTKPRTGCDYGWYTPEISVAIEPTHFQPLPTPPEESE